MVIKLEPVILPSAINVLLENSVNPETAFAAIMFPPLMLPVAVIRPVVLILPAVILPVAVTVVP